MSSSIRLELAVDDVNLVLEALGKLPFVQVYQVIARIQAQAQAQIQGAGGDAQMRVEIDDGSRPQP